MKLPPRAVVAMIHLGALPGTPLGRETISAILARACEEAEIYRAAEVDAVIIENMHDLPYLKGAVGPEITASMAVIGGAVKRVVGEMPCGIQILAGANREALAAALAGGLDFIRAEGFVFGHVADEGWIDASAGELMRYRRQIGAEAIAVWCDVKKKHSAHAATADVDIAETAHAAEFFLADAVIITGAATGRAADLGEVRRVKATVRVPVVIGSGVTADNVRACLDVADAVIVGSSLKQGGRWSGAVERQRVERLLAAR